MQRCRIQAESWDQPVLIAAPGELDRLQRVLRLRPGDTVAVYDGCGRVGEACLTAGANGHGVGLLKTAGPETQAISALPVYLFQAIPKSARMDWLVEKATELGVDTLVPLLTDRGIVRPDSRSAGHRLQRWRRIAQQAVRQCGLARVPDINAPCSLADALTRVTDQGMAGLYGSLEPDAMPLQTALEPSGLTDALAVFIGPEGDFTPDECARLRSAGMRPITLGPRVLRVETAAIAVLAILGDRLSYR